MDLAFQIVFSVTVVLSLVGIVLLMVGLTRARGDEERVIFTASQWQLSGTVTGGAMVIASVLRGQYDELLFGDVFLVAATGGLAGATLNGLARWRRGQAGEGVLSGFSLVLRLVCGVLAAFATDTL